VSLWGSALPGVGVAGCGTDGGTGADAIGGFESALGDAGAGVATGDITGLIGAGSNNWDCRGAVGMAAGATAGAGTGVRTTGTVTGTGEVPEAAGDAVPWDTSARGLCGTAPLGAPEVTASPSVDRGADAARSGESKGAGVAGAVGAAGDVVGFPSDSPPEPAPAPGSAVETAGVLTGVRPGCAFAINEGELDADALSADPGEGEGEVGAGFAPMLLGTAAVASPCICGTVSDALAGASAGARAGKLLGTGIAVTGAFNAAAGGVSIGSGFLGMTGRGTAATAAGGTGSSDSEAIEGTVEGARGAEGVGTTALAVSDSRTFSSLKAEAAIGGVSGATAC